MTMLDPTAAPSGADARAFVLLKSGRRLDLLNPDPVDDEACRVAMREPGGTMRAVADDV